MRFRSVSVRHVLIKRLRLFLKMPLPEKHQQVTTPKTKRGLILFRKIASLKLEA